MRRNVRFPYTIFDFDSDLNPNTAPLWMESTPNADAVGYETRLEWGDWRLIVNFRFIAAHLPAP